MRTKSVQADIKILTGTIFQQPSGPLESWRRVHHRTILYVDYTQTIPASCIEIELHIVLHKGTTDQGYGRCFLYIFGVVLRWLGVTCARVGPSVPLCGLERFVLLQMCRT